jgi:nicotinamidase-related amidase
MDKLGIIDRNRTVFVLIDAQERLVSAMDGGEAMLESANRLVEASKILGIPLIVTEQYPKGLGPTSSRISLPDGTRPVEKVTFSCFGSEDFVQRLRHLGRDTIVVFGTESHICVLKSALDAMREGFHVHVAADAVSSRSGKDRQAGIERMRQSGAFIASSEMILFQLMDKAGSEEFKAISALVK